MGGKWKKNLFLFCKQIVTLAQHPSWLSIPNTVYWSTSTWKKSSSDFFANIYCYRIYTWTCSHWPLHLQSCHTRPFSRTLIPCIWTSAVYPVPTWRISIGSGSLLSTSKGSRGLSKSSASVLSLYWKSDQIWDTSLKKKIGLDLKWT